jgi:hypothetical protein
MTFLEERLEYVLRGQSVRGLSPPGTENMLFSHVAQVRLDVKRSMQPPDLVGQQGNQYRSAVSDAMQHFLISSRQNQLKLLLSRSYIPTSDLPFIFPLYTTRDVDFLVFWEIPQERRAGQILIPGLTLGAGHGALNDVLSRIENVARIMFAETTRERDAMLDVLQHSSWNEENDPVILGVHAEERVLHDFSKGYVLSHCLSNITAHMPAALAWLMSRLTCETSRHLKSNISWNYKLIPTSLHLSALLFFVRCCGNTWLMV